MQETVYHRDFHSSLVPLNVLLWLAVLWVIAGHYKTGWWWSVLQCCSNAALWPGVHSLSTVTRSHVLQREVKSSRKMDKRWGMEERWRLVGFYSRWIGKRTSLMEMAHTHTLTHTKRLTWCAQGSDLINKRRPFCFIHLSFFSHSSISLLSPLCVSELLAVGELLRGMIKEGVDEWGETQHRRINMCKQESSDWSRTFPSSPTILKGSF